MVCSRSPQGETVSPLITTHILKGPSVVAKDVVGPNLVARVFEGACAAAYWSSALPKSQLKPYGGFSCVFLGARKRCFSRIYCMCLLAAAAHISVTPGLHLALPGLYVFPAKVRVMGWPPGHRPLAWGQKRHL